MRQNNRKGFCLDEILAEFIFVMQKTQFCFNLIRSKSKSSQNSPIKSLHFRLFNENYITFIQRKFATDGHFEETQFANA